MAQRFPPQHYQREILHVEVGPSKEDKKCTPEVELKPLPSHLRCEFLGMNDTFPVIISASLDGTQIAKLLSVLKKYKDVMGYSINDIKGISPSFCMHRILLNNEHQPSRQSQRRFNPKIQEVVKKEVVKLLDA